MTRKDKRHGHGHEHDAHGHPGHPQGHGPHHELHPHDPKPPGEVVNPPSPTPGEDIDIAAVARFAAGLFVAVVVAAGLMFLLMRQLGRHSAAQDPAGPAAPGQPRETLSEYGENVTRPDGGVRLQRVPFDDMNARREHDAGLLRDYGWVDRQNEIVRLRIDVAKRLIVQRGLPVREPLPEASPIPVTAAPAASATAAPRPTPAATRRPTPRPAPAAAPEGGA